MRYAWVLAALTVLPVTARAEGDAAAGKTVFSQCAICHSNKKGVNKIGPSLFEVVGRPSHSEPGFTYSDAMKSYDVTWDPQTLDHYLVDPRKVVPGTKMIFLGIKDDAKRADLIAYLADAQIDRAAAGFRRCGRSGSRARTGRGSGGPGLGFREVVRDEQRGARPRAPGLQEQLTRGGCRSRVQRYERLVEQDQFRLDRERPGQRDPARHPERQRARILLGHLLEAQFARAGHWLAPGRGGRTKARFCRTVRQGSSSGSWNTVPIRGACPSVQPTAPSNAVIQPADDAQRGGLAAAGRPDERDDLALAQPRTADRRSRRAAPRHSAPACGGPRQSASAAIGWPSAPAAAAAPTRSPAPRS